RSMPDFTCIICHAPCAGTFCEPCGRSYDRSAHEEGTVYEAMRWAANRAVRMRGAIRRRSPGIAWIAVDSDEIKMLLDRLSAGWEESEESGWDELLSKVERARDLLAEDE